MGSRRHRQTANILSKRNKTGIGKESVCGVEDIDVVEEGDIQNQSS
jgi:hypothetical protein